jgi:acyl carrier protein
MNKKQFMNELESILDISSETLKESTILATLSQWDSMAKLSLIVLLSESFNLKISSQELNHFKVVNDILKFCSLA